MSQHRYEMVIRKIGNQRRDHIQNCNTMTGMTAPENPSSPRCSLVQTGSTPNLVNGEPQIRPSSQAVNQTQGVVRSGLGLNPILDQTLASLGPRWVKQPIKTLMTTSNPMPSSLKLTGNG